MGTTPKKILAWVGVVAAVLLLLAFGFWRHLFRSYTPREVRDDIKAAVAARNSPKRVERFLELRYGPLTDPQNRQRAFLDFFNPGHIRGLHLIVQHTPAEMKLANNLAMAEWIASYRRTMTPEEKKSLGQFFSSETGRSRLREATGQYLSQDVHYRGMSAPVIRELLVTVAEVQKP